MGFYNSLYKNSLNLKYRIKRLKKNVFYCVETDIMKVNETRMQSKLVITSHTKPLKNDLLTEVTS